MCDHSIDYSLKQVLRGTPIGDSMSAECYRCGTPLAEGMPVTIAAHRQSDESWWHCHAVYCAGCGPTEIHAPTPTMDELVAEGRLGVTTDVTVQGAYLTLVKPDVVEYCGRVKRLKS